MICIYIYTVYCHILHTYHIYDIFMSVKDIGFVHDIAKLSMVGYYFANHSKIDAVYILTRIVTAVLFVVDGCNFF